MVETVETHCGATSETFPAYLSMNENMAGMTSAPPLRHCLRELLMRAACCEPWDPEGNSMSPSRVWMASLGLAHPLPPPLQGADAGSIWSEESREWMLDGFCDAAYAAMCTTGRGVSTSDDLRLNATAATTALRQVIPFCLRPAQVQRLVILMSGCEAFRQEVASLVLWLWRHPRRNHYAEWLVECCRNLLQSVNGGRAGQGVEKLRSACIAVLTQEGYRESLDEVMMEELEICLNDLDASLWHSACPNHDQARRALSILSTLPLNSISFSRAIARIASHRAVDPAGAHRILSSLLTCAAGGRVVRGGAHAVMALWQASRVGSTCGTRPVDGVVQEAFRVHDVMGGAEAIHMAASALERWGDRNLGAEPGDEQLLAWLPSARLQQAVEASRQAIKRYHVESLRAATLSLRAHAVMSRGGKSGAAALIAMTACSLECGEGTEAEWASVLWALSGNSKRHRGVIGARRARALREALVLLSSLVKSGTLGLVSDIAWAWEGVEGWPQKNDGPIPGWSGVQAAARSRLVGIAGLARIASRSG